MPIPTPPPPGANNGGFIILSYTNGTRTHRVRFYVAPFAASTGVYTVAQGTENDVSTTAATLRDKLKPLYSPNWTFAWAALYQHQSGVPVQLPLTAVVATAIGTGGAGDTPDWEGFFCFNMKSTLLGRGKFFMIEPDYWSYALPVNLNAASAAPYGAIVTYLTGGNTGVVMHDGGRVTSPIRQTYGYNRKLRRRYGHA